MKEITMSDTPLKYWDRYHNEILEDQVYADWFIRFCYEHKAGRKFLDYFFSQKSFNLLYGLYKNSKFSLKQIQKDIHQYEVDMDLFIESPFECYSDFFLRHFKPGKRPFPTAPDSLGSFAEGRILAFESITSEHKFPVKGKHLTSQALMGKNVDAKTFDGGPIIIARLCPIDYHHFHYPDTGKVIKRYRIGGVYHSVNVLALKNQPDVFENNEREITIIETENFGKMAYIEVGAMCVGKIIQDNPHAQDFKRGELKGHFEFGASTVIILGEPGKWKPSADILEHSHKNIESYIKLGDEVAKKIK
jgi:phosphatidylserine decarboxylase